MNRLKNINYEDTPKHEVSDKALESLKKVMYQQDLIGIKKYGEPIQHYLSYDWEAMADQEIADYLKYRQCERERKAYVIELLRTGLSSNEPKDFIEVALQLLTVEGTSK